MKGQDTPNCLNCIHYYVSWDPALPRACRLFGIKSLALPALAVRANTGLPCPGFRALEKNQGIQKKHKTDLRV